MADHQLDFGRKARIGMHEAVFCPPKTAAQIQAILADAEKQNQAMLLTKLCPEKAEALSGIDYDILSQTAFFGAPRPIKGDCKIAIATGGTGDLPIAMEAKRTLAFDGVPSALIADIGVAGLWRLTSRAEELARFPIVIAVAGMDAAMPTVLAGLIPGIVIAVPVSTGYGAARGGETALAACLASCAPGLTVTNIDNGYGAACAAMRAISVFSGLQGV